MTTEALLKAGATAKRREELVDATGTSEKVILGWAYRRGSPATTRPREPGLNMPVLAF